MFTWGPVVLYVLLILAISSVPRLRPPGMLRGWDKVVHFLEYGILGILLYRAMPARGFRRWLATLGIGAAVGFLDELYQSTVPGRSTSASDWLADLGGVCFGIVGCALAARARLVETGKGE